MVLFKQLYSLVLLGIKYYFVWFYLHTIGRKILKSNIILVSEKRREARDNGYYMFKYLREQQSSENAYYMITRDSADWDKVSNLGNVVEYNTFKHCLFFLGAKCLMFCQTDSSPYEEIRGHARYDFLRRKDQIRIYLTHGICKDDVAMSYDYKLAGYNIFVCGAKPEYDYYKKIYDYPDNNIALTGLCRYDGLSDFEVKANQILIMPTYREWLRTTDSAKSCASDKEETMMKESLFFTRYISLLNNKKLKDFLIHYDCKLMFYLHYTIQPYTNLFKKKLDNDRVVVCDRKEYDVQELLKSSQILVTDYSSVAFDFSYMRKPLSYYQFDYEQYRSLHYKEGWFNYERDGLGPVIKDEELLIEWIINSLKNKDEDKKYLLRIKEFFPYSDSKNSERVYEAYINYK